MLQLHFSALQGTYCQWELLPLMEMVQGTFPYLSYAIDSVIDIRDEITRGVPPDFVFLRQSYG